MGCRQPANKYPACRDGISSAASRRLAFRMAICQILVRHKLLGAHASFFQAEGEHLGCRNARADWVLPAGPGLERGSLARQVVTGHCLAQLPARRV
jgi:hypothetical protein